MRPRYCTRTCSRSSLDAAAALAARPCCSYSCQLSLTRSPWSKGLRSADSAPARERGGYAAGAAAPVSDRGEVNRNGRAGVAIWAAYRPCPPTTASPGSTTPGRSASSRTSRSTSSGRGNGAGPVVELGVGTGRIAVPIAAEGIEVIGVDLSEGMLEVARERAALAGVDGRPPLRRLPRPAGRGAGAARDRPVPLAAAHADRRGPPRGRARRPPAARAGRPLRLRRLLARARRTSPRPTAAGSSASPASSSGPTGTRRPGR